MFGLRPFARTAISSRQWTCLKCSQERPCLLEPPKLSIAWNQRAGYANSGATSAQGARDHTQDAAEATRRFTKSRKRRRRLAITAGFGAALVGLVAFTDSGQKAYHGSIRAGRVLTTLTTNIRDYRKTLELREDPSCSKETYTDKLKACHKRCAVRTLHAMEANGSIFIKLGQHLTSLNYLLPSEWCDTFIPLQDQCPVTPFPSIKAMVEHDTAQPFTTLFCAFDETPLGAASLAQVHLATDASTNQRVAVKVQHPVLDDWAPLDLALTRFSFQTLKRVFPDYDLTPLADEVSVSLPQELDFALEGANATRARDYFSHLPQIPLLIPQVLWSRRRILVMEYITGHRLDDLHYLDANSIPRDEVSASLSRLFNTMIFSPGAPLHCDPHGGNIAIRANPARKGRHNFDIVLYDHGLYRTIPLQLQRDYAKLWLAVLDGDETGMRSAAHAVAAITDEQFPLFASAITGRDYRVIASKRVDSGRTAEEKQAMSDALGDGLLQQLVRLLGQVPRIILLILKTNDLTRSLDAKLKTRKGPIRQFLILARYAAATVLEEQLEGLRRVGGLFWPPGNAVGAVRAWGRYGVVVGKLGVYECWLWVRGLLGLGNELPGGGLMDEMG